MRARQLMRFISAFLFALVVLVAGHFALWFVSAHQAERRIVTTLSGIEGMEIDHGAIARSGYPYSVRLTLNDVRIAWDKPQDGLEVVYAPGDVTVSTDLFKHDKVAIELPKQQSLSLTHARSGQKNYTILMEGGRVTYLNRGGPNELALNIDALTMMDSTTQEPALRTAACYLVRSQPGQSTPTDWRLSMNKLSLGDAFVGTPLMLDQLQAHFGMMSGGTTSLTEVLGMTIGAPQAEKTEALSKLFEAMARNHTNMRVHGFRVAMGDFWFTLRGELGVDSLVRPQGKVSLTTNGIAEVLGYMAENKTVEPKRIEQNKQLARMFEDMGNLNISLTFRDGVMMFNGLPVGEVMPLPKLLQNMEQNQ